MTVAIHAFEPGDRVTWLYAPRAGYGFVIPVAGVVLKVGPKRVRIRVAFRTYIDRQWRVAERWVSPLQLKPRSKIVPEVDSRV